MKWLKSLFGGQPETKSNIAGSVQTPQSIYKKFINGRTGTDIVAATKDIEACLGKRDSSSDQLMDLLKPKVEMPRTGPTGRPLLDLTGGRPDTPQWIAFKVIVEQDNPYYDEYMSWIRQNIAGFNRKWIRTIINHLSTTSTVEAVRKQCQDCSNHI
jgi:hypothetical protein